MKLKINITGNRLIIASLVATLITMGACVELDEDPGKANLAPGAYSTLEELELGVNGIYAQFRRAAWMTTFFVNGWSGDDITTHNASNKADFREYDQRAVTEVNARTRNNWSAIYSMVRSANSVILSSSELDLSDKEAQNRLIGEAYFLRGFMFFQLTRVHSEIPLPLDPIPDFEIEKSSQLEVYQQIESDLKTAEEMLPDLYPGAREGAPRPNKGTARAFLARLYLDWAGFPMKDQAKYAMAAAEAGEVIANKTAHGFELLPKCEDLWTLNNKFNSEGVFTMSYCKPCGGGFANRKYGKLGHPSDLGGWQETFAEIRFFEDFPEGPRKEATYRTDYEWETFTDQKNPVFQKIVGPPGEIPQSDWQTDRNDFLMRYAEVLLIYAEASARAGTPSDDAWTAYNMIRRRAAGEPFDQDSPNDITSGDLAELVFTERKWEFAGEYIRWNDLVRMERVEEALSNRDPRSSYHPDTGELLQESNPIIGSLGTDNYFAPIPPEDIELNPGLGSGGD